MRTHHRLGAIVATLALFVAPAAFACGGYGQHATMHAPAPAPVVYAPAPAPVFYQTATFNQHQHNKQMHNKQMHNKQMHNKQMHNKKWAQAARVRMAAPVVYAKPVVVVQTQPSYKNHQNPGWKQNGAYNQGQPQVVVVKQAQAHNQHGKAGHHGKQFAQGGHW